MRVEKEDTRLLPNDCGRVEVGPVLVADCRELGRRLVQEVGHASDACERGCEDDGAVELQVGKLKVVRRTRQPGQQTARLTERGDPAGPCQQPAAGLE